jgi:membrane-bound lytic murein transglycosylase B
MMARTLSLATLMLAISTIACAQEPPPYVPPAFATSGSPEFDAWRTRFAYRAVQVEKKDRAIVEATLMGLAPNPEIKRLNEAQPEFTRPIWAYIASAVSGPRIAQGRTLFAQNRDRLLGMSTTIGVPIEYAVAIWGLESGYGSNKGNGDVVRSLASLAYQGRRTALGESELLAVFDIIARGEATRSTLVGSWAGAMGHTQFMPSSYLSRAVDGDNDGKRDIWNTPVDALASTLNYLSKAGWKGTEPWGFEASAPASFDWSLADGTMRPVSFWNSVGITRATGARPDDMPQDRPMRLLVPAGAGGAIFLVGGNFDSIRSYNASDSYALSIALLGDQIAGRGVLPTRWPTTNPPLGRTDAIELQGLLLGLSDRYTRRASRATHAGCVAGLPKVAECVGRWLSLIHRFGCRASRGCAGRGDLDTASGWRTGNSATSIGRSDTRCEHAGSANIDTTPLAYRAATAVKA